MSTFLRVLVPPLAAAALGCSTTLSTLQPAETLKEGSIHAGVAANVNAPVGRVIDVLGVGQTAATKVIQDGKYTPTQDEQQKLLDAAVGLGLNPPGATPDVMIRYGFYKGFDAGLRYSGSAMHVDAKAQFLGGGEDEWAGSISLGYSRARYHGIGFDVVDVVQIAEFSRHNLEVPLLFGRRLGPFGHVWAGPKYVGSYYRLDATIRNVGAVPTTSGVIHYLGGFAGVALGYKHVFAMAEITIADMIARPLVYGREVDVGGIVVMPSLGVMARLP
jgi:hypothetical protein